MRDNDERSAIAAGVKPSPTGSGEAGDGRWPGPVATIQRIRRGTHFAVYLDAPAGTILVRALGGAAAATLGECEAARRGHKNVEGAPARTQISLDLTEMFEAVRLYEHAESRMLVRETAELNQGTGAGPQRPDDPGGGEHKGRRSRRPARPRDQP